MLPVDSGGKTIRGILNACRIACFDGLGDQSDRGGMSVLVVLLLLAAGLASSDTQQHASQGTVILEGATFRLTRLSHPISSRVCGESALSLCFA